MWKRLFTTASLRSERTSVCTTRAKKALPTVSSETDSSSTAAGGTPCSTSQRALSCASWRSKPAASCGHGLCGVPHAVVITYGFGSGAIR